MQQTANHLLVNVLPAAEEYAAAEQQLSDTFNQNNTPAHWQASADRAKRLAANLALAIDGLVDRAKSETGLSMTDIRQQVGALCMWPGGSIVRAGALERVRGIANAYKHQNLSEKWTRFLGQFSRSG